MKATATALALLLGGASALLSFLALLGLSVHRHADPLVATMAGIVLVLLPPFAAGFAAPGPRRNWSRSPTIADSVVLSASTR